MNEQEVLEHIESYEMEIERIKKTFPPETAKVLVNDIQKDIDTLFSYVCPF
jgi:hypothetical protein